MGSVRRAFLYVTKKRGKSLLLCSLLLVMATFVLTGLSVEKAARVTQENLRRTLGGEFTVAPDMSENNPYFKTETDDEGNYSIYTELPITQDLIDTVMQTGGIRSYSAMSQCLVSTGLEVIPGNVPVKEKYRDRVYARLVSGTETNSFFEEGTLKLAEGSHLPPEGGHGAVVSRDLAEKNGLKIGDFITLQAEGGGTSRVEIVGLFEVDKRTQAFASVTSFDKLENQIFSSLEVYGELVTELTPGFQSAVFRVEDPAQLDAIVAQVLENHRVDWRAFQVETDNQTYQDAAAPLQRFQTLITSILVLITLASAVVLSLVLTLWAKSRIHETGVLLSLGIKKAAIVGQYLAEVLLIAVLAFGLSFFTSSLVADQLGNSLLQAQAQSKEAPSGGESESGMQVSVKGEQDGLVLNDGGESRPGPGSPAVEPLAVAVGLESMALLFLIGFAVIVLSVAVSSGVVMRLKPREILSKMS